MLATGAAMPSIREFIDHVRHRQADLQPHLRIPDGHVFAASGDPAPDEPDGLTAANHYFTVRVNGLRLDYDRVGGRVYDPMVLAITEFSYDGQDRSVPFVVSAARIHADDGVPGGMALDDTVVAGPHPYYGNLAVTLILYRVLREDYLRRALNAVQKTCGAFDLSGTLSTYLKIGDALLDSVDAILDQEDVEPVLGRRIAFGDSPRPGSFVLTPGALDAASLWLAGGDLRQGGELASAASVPKTSYVAYTLASAPAVDLSTLPWFQPIWKRVIEWAKIPSDEAKDVVKTYLGALYEEIATSPDVARDRVDEVYRYWEELAKAAHASARKLADWGPDAVRSDPVRARALAIREAW
jgi:hypothetical protein